MKNNAMNILRRASNWKSILPLFVILLGCMLFVFPKYRSDINTIANEKVRSLDGRINYNLEEVTRLFDTLGDEGREIYKIVSGRIDMAYPIVYCLFSILLLAYVIKKIIPPNSKWIYLSLSPLLGTMFDYIENFNILKMLNEYPNITTKQVAYSALMTQMKWIFLSLAFGVMIISLPMWLIKKLRNTKKA